MIELAFGEDPAGLLKLEKSMKQGECLLIEASVQKTINLFQEL